MAVALRRAAAGAARAAPGRGPADPDLKTEGRNAGGGPASESARTRGRSRRPRSGAAAPTRKRGAAARSEISPGDDALSKACPANGGQIPTTTTPPPPPPPSLGVATPFYSSF